MKPPYSTRFEIESLWILNTKHNLVKLSVLIFTQIETRTMTSTLFPTTSGVSCQLNPEEGRTLHPSPPRPPVPRSPSKGETKYVDTLQTLKGCHSYVVRGCTCVYTPLGPFRYLHPSSSLVPLSLLSCVVLRSTHPYHSSSVPTVVPVKDFRRIQRYGARPVWFVRKPGVDWVRRPWPIRYFFRTAATSRVFRGSLSSGNKGWMEPRVPPCSVCLVKGNILLIPDYIILIIRPFNKISYLFYINSL